MNQSRWKLFPRCDEIKIPSVVSVIETWHSTSSINRALSIENDGVDAQSELCCSGCSFAPDDATIVSTTSIFSHYDQHEKADDAESNPPFAFSSVWEIDEDLEAEDCGCMFTYSSRPAPRFSRCGNILSTIMNGYQKGISLVSYTLKDDVKHFNERSILCTGASLCGRIQCCVFSPCKDMAALVNDLYIGGQEMSTYELTIWKIKQPVQFHCLWSVKLASLCKNLTGKVRDCKFSPDGEALGILSTAGILIFIDIRSRRLYGKSELSAQPNGLRAVYRCFDFDPWYKKNIFMAGYLHKLVVMKICKDACVLQLEVDLPDENTLVNHVGYSRNSTLVAVSACNGNVYVYNVPAGILAYTLVSGEQGSFSSPCCLHSSFSSSSQELVSAYSNGLVKIWQLHRVTSLKEVCRLRVRALYTDEEIKMFEMPKKLVQYLFFLPKR